MDYVIGGISVAALIFGIVEAAKELGVTGNGSRVLALLVGAFFVGLAQAVSQGLIPADVLPYVELFVVAVGGALAAMGYYDFAKKFITPRLSDFASGTLYVDPGLGEPDAPQVEQL